MRLVSIILALTFVSAQKPQKRKPATIFDAKLIMDNWDKNKDGFLSINEADPIYNAKCNKMRNDDLEKAQRTRGFEIHPEQVPKVKAGQAKACKKEFDQWWTQVAADD